VILPDVRGLHPYYEELALRFAEHAVDAVAIDYFGRTALDDDRGEGFDYGPHVEQMRWASTSADVRAAADELRRDGRVTSVFTIGFCRGGRLAFDTATLGLGLAGVIGFYGWPVGSRGTDSPPPVDVVTDFECPVLGIFGGADQGIPQAAVHEFEQALERAGVEHRIVLEPEAPHSFFDRKAEEFAEAADRAWTETLQFIRSHTKAAAAA
jgi:carboxymethylenebutenolidase